MRFIPIICKVPGYSENKSDIILILQPHSINSTVRLLLDPIKSTAHHTRCMHTSAVCHTACRPSCRIHTGCGGGVTRRECDLFKVLRFASAFQLNILHFHATAEGAARCRGRDSFDVLLPCAARSAELPTLRFTIWRPKTI